VKPKDAVDNLVYVFDVQNKQDFLDVNKAQNMLEARRKCHIL